MKKPSYSIYQQIGDFSPVKVETFRSESEALAKVRIYIRQDKYEHEVGGYGFPYGYPQYYVEKED